MQIINFAYVTNQGVIEWVSAADQSRTLPKSFQLKGNKKLKV